MKIDGILHRDLASSTPRSPGGNLDPHGHSVQFYGADSFLLDELTHFIGSALGEGNVGLIIATETHRAGLAQRLQACGLDLSLARQQGRYIALDAVDTLSKFMRGGWPDALCFASTLEDIFRHATVGAQGKYPRVAAFGEMVALLCAEGKVEAAIRLEQLWNELARKHSFELRCAYPLSLFCRVGDEEQLARICSEHSQVIPSESYASLTSEEDRHRSIIRLQQKAQALETEVEERKKAQETLQRREAEMADFLENALEGVQQVDADQIIRWANQAQLKLLGYATEEYVGHPLGEFYADRPVFVEFWRKLMSREDIYDYPAELRCKDGSVKHVLIHSNGLWEAGQFVHTRCFVRDITEQKRMEQTLRESALRAEAAVQARDRFLSIAAHELRTPVTALKGSAQLLRRRQARGELDEARLRRTLVVFEESANQLAQLTSDLLDISRIQTDNLALACQVLDFSALVERAVDRADDQGEDNHLLEVQLPAEPAVVWGDADRLDQVLTNLLDNARKYSSAKGPVTIQLESGANEGWQLAVRDRGIGLARGASDIIFEPFGRAPNATASHLPGMGLGLYISRNIVERHGGQIWAESAGEGLGAAFFVWLPRCPVPAETPVVR